MLNSPNKAAAGNCAVAIYFKSDAAVAQCLTSDR